MHTVRNRPTTCNMRRHRVLVTLATLSVMAPLLAPSLVSAGPAAGGGRPFIKAQTIGIPASPTGQSACNLQTWGHFDLDCVAAIVTDERLRRRLDTAGKENGTGAMPQSALSTVSRIIAI